MLKKGGESIIYKCQTVEDIDPSLVRFSFRLMSSRMKLKFGLRTKGVLENFPFVQTTNFTPKTIVEFCKSVLLQRVPIPV